MANQNMRLRKAVKLAEDLGCTVRMNGGDIFFHPPNGGKPVFQHGSKKDATPKVLGYLRKLQEEALKPKDPVVSAPAAPPVQLRKPTKVTPAKPWYTQDWHNPKPAVAVKETPIPPQPDSTAVQSSPAPSLAATPMVLPPAPALKDMMAPARDLAKLDEDIQQFEKELQAMKERRELHILDLDNIPQYIREICAKRWGWGAESITATVPKTALTRTVPTKRYDSRTPVTNRLAYAKWLLEVFYNSGLSTKVSGPSLDTRVMSRRAEIHEGKAMRTKYLSELGKARFLLRIGNNNRRVVWALNPNWRTEVDRTKLSTYLLRAFLDFSNGMHPQLATAAVK